MSEHQHPTGKPPKERLRIENRFWEKVDYDAGEDECWEWQACAYDYGWFNVGDNRAWPAHRVAWMLDAGLTPAEMDSTTQIRHQCHHKTCCNPSHLVPGDAGDNRIDSMRDGEIDTKLSPDDVREIRRLDAESDMSQRDIAGEFGISHGMVWQVVTGRQYAWVESDE